MKQFKQSLHRRLQRRKANARYKANHPERYKESQQQYYLRNRDEINKKTNESNKKRRQINPELAKEKDRKHYASKTYKDWIEKNRDRLREYRKLWRIGNVIKAREYSRLWKAENKEKSSANKKVLTALKNGSLKKYPCNICKSENVQAHHPDYSKPLDVIWLCVAHHKILHRKYHY